MAQPLEFEVRKGDVVMNTQTQPPTPWVVLEVPSDADLPNGVNAVPLGTNAQGQTTVHEQGGSIFGHQMVPTMQHLSDTQLIAGRRSYLIEEAVAQFARRSPAAPNMSIIEPIADMQAHQFGADLAQKPAGPKTLRRA